jgi:penicillin amidase
LRAFAREHGLIRAPALDALGAETGPRFSHAWVVGGSRTTTGAPVLISDPQTPVRNPSLLYEFHIKGATFNARGVGVAGSPIVLIGFNETVAWGMTALGADQADLFVLETDAERPNEYQVDGEWRAIETREETIQVKDGRPVNLTFKRSHLGPIVTPLVDARPGDEVALKRIPLVDRDRDTIQGGIAMMRARDIGEFRRALEGWRYPSANVVYGDKSGAIGYIALAAIPIRSPSAIDGGHVAHDGSTSAGDWRAILPYDLLPQMTNPARGYVMSANHRPIASFYPIPIGVSTGAMGDTDRSYRLRELLEARERFTPEDVLATHMDSVNAIKRDIARFGFHLRDAQGGAHLEEETLRCLEYLEGWRAAGEKLDLSIPGAEILTLMPLAFRQNFEAARVYGGGFSGLALMC